MHWIIFMTSQDVYYALSYVLVEHPVFHEPIFVLINVYTYIYLYIKPISNFSKLVLQFKT